MLREREGRPTGTMVTAVDSSDAGSLSDLLNTTDDDEKEASLETKIEPVGPSSHRGTVVQFIQSHSPTLASKLPMPFSAALQVAVFFGVWLQKVPTSHPLYYVPVGGGGRKQPEGSVLFSAVYQALRRANGQVRRASLPRPF